MSEKECKFAQSVIKQSASIEVSEDVLQHTARCSDCREALHVAKWMRAFAATTAPQPRSLPAPGLIWWKSQLIKRQAAAERATKPIRLAQWISYGLVALTFLWWLIKNPARVNGQVEKLEPAWSGLLASLELVAVPLLIGFACATVACGLLFFSFRALSIDDYLGKSNPRERV